MEILRTYGLRALFIAVLQGFIVGVSCSALGAEGPWAGETRLTYLFGPAHDPEVAMNSDTVYVVWSENILLDGTSELLFLRSANGLITWEQPQRLTYNSWIDEQPDFLYQQGTLHVVYVDFRDGVYPQGGEIYYLRSPNGGDYWEEPRRLSTGASYSLTPRLAIAPDGTLYVAFWDFRTGVTNIFLTKSTDNGQTWAPETIVTELDYQVDSTHPTIMVDSSGVVHLAWMDTRDAWPFGGHAPNTIVYMRSWDNGATWSYPPMRLGSAPPNRFFEHYGIMLTCDEADRLYLSYWADNQGSNVFVRSSLDGGYSWGPIIRVSDFGPDHPQLDFFEAAYPDLYFRDGAIDLVYYSHVQQAVENPRLMGDVFLKSSTDQGLTWAPAQQMTVGGRARVPKLTGNGSWRFLLWEDEKNYLPPYIDTFGAELYYRATQQQQLPAQLLVLLGGYELTALSSDQPGLLKLLVYALNPSGDSAIRSVELCYNRLPLGVYLTDDGLNGDYGADDGIYGIELDVPVGAPPGSYLLEVRVEDSRGEVAWWPYLQIDESKNSRFFNENRPAEWARPLLHPPITRGYPPHNPFIMFGGYWYTALSEDSGGTLTILAVLQDARGIEFVSTVELYYAGMATGVLLSDDGISGGLGDWTPGDGIFTLVTVIPPGALADFAGDYLFEVVATDVDGDSVSWPSLTLYE